MQSFEMLDINDPTETATPWNQKKSTDSILEESAQQIKQLNSYEA